MKLEYLGHTGHTRAWGCYWIVAIQIKQEVDTYFSSAFALRASARLRHAKSVHLQIQAAARETKNAGGFRDVAGRALECGLNHVPLDLFDGRRESCPPAPGSWAIFGGLIVDTKDR